MKLESQLSKMIVDMALEGKAAYMRGIGHLQSTWRDLLLGDDGLRQSFVVEAQSLTFKAVEAKNPLSMRISAYLRNVAVRGADVVGLNQRAGWLSAIVEHMREPDRAPPSTTSDERRRHSDASVGEARIDEDQQDDIAADTMEPTTTLPVETSMASTDERFADDTIVIESGPRKRRRVDLNDVNLAKGMGKSVRPRASKRKRWGAFLKGKSMTRTEEPEAKPRPKEMRYLHKSPTNNEYLVSCLTLEYVCIAEQCMQLEQDKNVIEVYVPQVTSNTEPAGQLQGEDYIRKSFSLNKWTSMVCLVRTEMKGVI